MELLNSDPSLAPLVTMIVGTEHGKVRYRDLRYFILSKNDEGHFNAKRAQATYDFFMPAQAREKEEPRENPFFAMNMDLHLKK